MLPDLVNGQFDLRSKNHPWFIKFATLSTVYLNHPGSEQVTEQTLAYMKYNIKHLSCAQSWRARFAKKKFE